MQEIIFGIFAHPDDEVLVAGTLMQRASEGAEINMILATDGENGINPSNADNLGKLRLDEWHTSGELLAVSHMQALHFHDNALETEPYDNIARTICETVLAHLATHAAACDVTLITFDTDGITGHHDHQMVTRAVTDVFKYLQDEVAPQVNVRSLLYYRLSKEQANAGPAIPGYPLSGYAPETCDKVVDCAAFVTRKVAIMNCHQTQMQDMRAWQQLPEELLAKEYYRELTSPDQES